MSINQRKVHKLKNGSTAIISSNSCSKSVTVYFLFKVGSRDEPPSLYGVAHFLEHLFFKGTCNRPEAKMIAETIDQYGGIFNAFTSRDMTGYYIKLPPKHLSIAIKILSDMMINSIFDPREIKTEKAVVINELKMRSSDPGQRLDEEMATLLYKNTDLAHPIGGDKTTVCKLKREDLATFVINHYIPKNMIVSIAGKIRPSIKSTLNLLNSCFSTDMTKRYYTFLSSSYLTSPTSSTIPLKSIILPKTKYYPNFYKQQKSFRFKSIHNKELEHTFISLAFPVINYKDPHSYLLELLTVILAGNMSSRLFISLRERRGLVYNVSCSTEYYKDTGSFAITCSTFNNREIVLKTLKQIGNEIKLLKNAPISDHELKKATEYILGSLEMKMEQTNDMAFDQASDYIYLNKLITPKILKKLYAKITPNMIIKTANKFFIKKRLNLVILSPLRFKASSIVI